MSKYTAEQRTQAFEAFKEQQRVLHPPPVKKRAEGINGLVIVALVLIALASGWVSATRTVEGFANSYQGTLQDIASATDASDLEPNPLVRLSVGLAAFIALEFAVAVYSFMSIRMNSEKAHNTKRYIAIGKWLSIAIVVLEALHVVFKGATVGTTPSGFEAAVIGFTSTVVPVMLAVAPPALLFISFELLAIIYMTDKNKQARLDAEHAQAMQSWHESVLERWNNGTVRGQFMKEWTPNGQRTDSGQKRTNSGHRTDERTAGGQADTERAPNGRRRTKADIVREYLEQHPDAIGLSVNELRDRMLEDGYTVGRTTIAEVLKEMREQNAA